MVRLTCSSTKLQLYHAKAETLPIFVLAVAKLRLQLYHAKAETLPLVAPRSFSISLQLYHAKAETIRDDTPRMFVRRRLQLYHAKAETRANLQLYHASATILSIPHFFLYCKLNSTYRDTIQFLSYHRCMSAASR